MNPGEGPGRPPPASAAARSLFERAFARHQAGDLPAAEALYRQVLAVQPAHADGLHLLGLVLAQSGRPEDAVPLIRRAIAARPDFDLALYNLGNVLRRLERLGEAVDAYQGALRLRPNAPNVLVNLGAVLRSLGRLDEAVEAYRRALVVNPADAAAHYNLGCALQQMGRGEEAVRAYRQALALKPNDPDAWANLGAALLALARPGEAVAAARRRTELEPTSAEAFGALAAALLAAGLADPAVQAARCAVQLQPGDAGAHIHLGNALLERGGLEAAVAAYRRAVSLAPDDAPGWVNLAIGLQEAGDAAGAAAAVARALAVDPGSAAAWAVRAGLKTFQAGDPDLAALSSLLADGDARPLDDRVDLEFTFGKALMDAGEIDAAFAHLAAGNRLHRAGLGYDVRDDVAQFAEIARALGGENLGLQDLAGRAGRGVPSDLPVFIVGMPRSGTTLVEQILASHPDVFGAGELPVLEGILMERLGVPLSPTARARRLAGLSPEDLQAMGGAYVARVSALSPGSRRVIDKMPSNFRLAGLIHLILPNARIIHCRRDPVDTCLSCYTRKFSRGQDFAYDLGELGTYYRAYEDLMAHWRQRLPPDRFMEVAYEAVVDDLEGQARRLIAFCGLDWDDACLAFHQTSRQVRTASVNQVRQPLYRGSVARWKAFEAHLGPLLEALNSRA